MSSNISEKLKTINQTLKKLNNHISIIENNKRKIVLYNNSNKNLASLNLSILDKKRKKLFNLDKIYRLKLDNKAQNESITDLVKSYQSKYRVDQISDWLWKKGVSNFSQMSNLSDSLRKSLGEKFCLNKPTKTTQI